MKNAEPSAKGVLTRMDPTICNGMLSVAYYAYIHAVTYKSLYAQCLVYSAGE